MLLGFALGMWEIAIILLVVILVFGPSKLPQLGSSVGKMLSGFKKEMKSMKEEEARSQAEDGEIDVTPVEDDKPRG